MIMVIKTIFPTQMKVVRKEINKFIGKIIYNTLKNAAVVI